MPTFSNELPSGKKHMGFDLWRTPPEKPLRAIITCDQIYVCDTHYWGGRTIPCERPNCPACNQSVPYRTHVYVSAFEPITHDHFLFECTAHAAQSFADYRRIADRLRGCYFHASRPKRTKNGKVAIICKPADLSKCQLPEPPNVMKALCTIWRVPFNAFEELDGRGNSKLQIPRKKVLDALNNQPDNQPEPRSIQDVLAEGSNGSAHRKQKN